MNFELLKKEMKKADLSAILVENTEIRDSNFFYLTGLKSGLFEPAIAIATQESMHVFVTPLDYNDAKKFLGKDIILMEYKKENLKKFLLQFKGEKIGVNSGLMPYSRYIELKSISKASSFVDCSELLKGLRQVKSDEEIQLITKANRITKKALQDTFDLLEENMTELQIVAKFEYQLKEYGADGLAFDTIVAFGANSAVPHHMPDNTKLKSNNIVLMDVGAKYQNYCADVSRTIIFNPDKSSKKYKDLVQMYDTVKKAQSLALGRMKVGSKASDIHNYAAKFINTVHNGIYNGKFIHSLGHSLGMDVHDGISIGPNSNVLLREGMVVTDEPGVYIENLGGVRIEDDIIISRKGPLVINKGILPP
ncbi:MAG: M24 family metallopeptidase [Candidatus Micrarchaeia archaeon]